MLTMSFRQSSGFIIIGDKGPENETPLQAAIREFLSTDLRLPDVCT